MQIVYDILDKIKDGTLNVKKLSEKTGIPKGRMYKWGKRASSITLEDAIELQKWGEDPANGFIQLSTQGRKLKRVDQPSNLGTHVEVLASDLKQIQQDLRAIFDSAERISDRLKLEQPSESDIVSKQMQKDIEDGKYTPGTGEIE